MIKGKLTLYLSIVDGIDPQKRALQDAIASIKKNKKDTLLFIGFSESLKILLKKDLPHAHRNKFLDGRVDKDKETLHLIFNSSTKAVVFNKIIDYHQKKDKLKLILQLLNAGINVYVPASLKNFELCNEELKKTFKIEIDAPLVPNTFFKYISRVILVSNYEESFELDHHNCPLKAVIISNPDINSKGRLANMVFILATHINYHSKHFSIEEKNTQYTHVSSQSSFSYLKKLQKIRTGLRYLYSRLKKNLFNISSSFIPILGSFFLAQNIGMNNNHYYNLLIFFLIWSAVLNLVTYSLIPTAVSVAFAVILSLYMPAFSDITPNFLLKGIGLFTGLFLFYVMLQNKKIIFQQKNELYNKEARLNFLYLYTEALATSSNHDEIFRISEQYFKNTFKLDIILVLQDPNSITKKHIITPSSNSVIQNPHEPFTLDQLNTPQYAQYEFTPLMADSVELGWIGMKAANLNPLLDPILLNSSILQLTIALQRYHLSQSYQSAVLSSEKEQLRSIILSSISHDLKTPLTTIIGSCTALEELENLSPKHKMVLIHTIHEASDQLNQFISNILDSSRLASENILQQNSLVYLDDVLNVILHRSKKTLSLFDVSVTVTNAEEAAVYGDFTLFQQVFFNIIENATKYVPVGGEIGIFVTNIMDKVFVRIYDNGPGIAESKRNIIFDKFYRFQHSDQQKAGTGLGLSICKQIIEAYKGKIWVSDRDDGQKGAQFNIELPCAFPQRRLEHKPTRIRK